MKTKLLKASPQYVQAVRHLLLDPDLVYWIGGQWGYAIGDIEIIQHLTALLLKVLNSPYENHVIKWKDDKWRSIGFESEKGKVWIAVKNEGLGLISVDWDKSVGDIIF